MIPPGCPRRIFVEPFPGILAPYARQTERWRQALLAWAHASSAEMAARIAGVLGYRASPDTSIRGQRAERFAFPAPRGLGVDELRFAVAARMVRCSWISECQPPVAVLEGRTAEPLTKWVQVHPTVAILVRDRAGAYALAGRQATPDALQVADRVTVSDALTVLLHSHQGHSSAPATGPMESVPVAAPMADPAEHPRTMPQPTPRKRAVWEAVHQRRNLGQPRRQIIRALGLDRRTVRRYLATDQAPVYPARRPRPTRLNPYLAYLPHAGPTGVRPPVSSITSSGNGDTKAPRAWAVWSFARGVHVGRATLQHSCLLTAHGLCCSRLVA